MNERKQSQITYVLQRVIAGLFAIMISIVGFILFRRKQ